MGFGSEIRFKIGGDDSSLNKTFDRAERRAEAAGRKMDRSLNSKAGLDTDRARGALARYREQAVFREANTIGKIKIVTGELADLAKEREGYEKGTTGHYKAQLQIEERRSKLKQLQAQAQQETVAGSDAAQGTTKNSGAKTDWRRILGGLVVTAATLAVEMVSNRIQTQTQKSQAQEAGSAGALESTRARLAAIGGLQGQVAQGKASLKDLEVNRDFEKRLNDQLSGGAQGLLSMVHPAQLNESNARLEQLNASIQKQHDLNALNQRELDRQTETYEAQSEFLSTQNRFRENGVASEAKLSEYALRRAAAQQEIEERLGNPQSVNAAKLAVQEAAQQQDAITQATRAHLLGINQDLTSQAAEGRTGRPRSETERLAQRAERFRQRARNAVLTGASQDAAHFMDSALAGEAGVTARLSGASSLVSKLDVGDSSAIKAEIVRSNQLLEGIMSALTVIDVTTGPQSGQFVDSSGSGGD